MANFICAKKGHLHYVAFLENTKLHFAVPFEDIGDEIFNDEMHAKSLIRYIVQPENTEA